MQAARIQDLQGIDISHWQGTVNWKAVKDDKINFVYLKCSEGKNWIDPTFLDHAREARYANLPVGAYHFARPDINVNQKDAVEEAKHFSKTLKRGFGNYGDICPVLDLEKPFPKDETVMSTSYLLSWVDTFRSHFEKETGHTLMLYTGIFFIRAYNNFRHPDSTYPLARMPLWIAFYPELASPYTAPPQDAGSWKKWTVWQYTDKGVVNGIEGEVDRNRAVPELLLNPVRK